ncbi:squalene/phytoene synthase family protein [Caulobacter sp. SLTY]|uniref:phytoene/squalene synthase family protein n=1 Tax=Caulobacter sp. SLTY TaxID=2683262 RepID=UPI001411FCF8|nr:phytoene/squalene synthase family protein [Caulobacter sp. SLTY]NBB17207.1 squalene/phytoene synthase family protein [Caulobacter sp. SLTY]
MSDLEATSREAITKGSQSFAAAAALFDAQTRTDAEMLYAWCRHCDDVIDGQTLGHGQAAVPPEQLRATLEDLYAKTRSALAGEPQSDPAFAAFGQVALRRRIPEQWAIELIDGFAMDVSGQRYEQFEETLKYCWHVAGAVGVMMAVVMGVKPDDLTTLRRAQDLGLAFQLTNIARDLVEDARNGRVYLPEVWLDEADLPADQITAPDRRDTLAALAETLMETAEPYYLSARWGLRALPFRSAWAVAAAGAVYRQIGIEVLRRGPRAWDTRVSTSTATKLRLLIQSAFTALRAVTLDRWREPPVRLPLWSRL